MTDKTEDTVDPKQQKIEQVQRDAKPLAGKGFSKEQIAQQLSSKHQMTTAEVTAILDQNKEDDK